MVIEYKVHRYSTDNYGVPLCRDCQGWINNMEHQPTEYALLLYFELIKKGVSVELEKFDGHKTIDIAVTGAKINIEVDGMQHSYSPQQAIADLKRTYYSLKKGYFTLRVPNELIRDDLNETAEWVANIIIEAKRLKEAR